MYSTVTYTAAYTILIIKHNSVGTIQWITAITTTGTSAPTPHALEVDASGNVYISSIIWPENGNLSIGASTIVTRPANSYMYAPIIKLTTAGTLAYAYMPVTGNGTYSTIVTAFKCIGTDVYALINSDADSTGTILTVSSQNGNAFRTFTGPGVSSTRTVFMKLNSIGTCQFAFLITTAGLQRANNIDFDSSGNMYIGGFLRANVTYTVNSLSGVSGETSSAITLVATTAEDGFIIAYNSSGVAQWARSLRASTTLDDSVKSILVIPGGIITASITNNSTTLTIYNGTTLVQTISISPLNIMSGIYTFFSTAGVYQGNMRFIADNTNYYASAYSITSDLSGNLYMAGMFNTSFKFYDISDNITSVAFPSDATNSAFIFKVSSSGRYLNHRVIHRNNFTTNTQLVSLTSPAKDLITVHLPTSGDMLRKFMPALLKGRILSIVFTPTVISGGTQQRLIDLNNGSTATFFQVAPIFNSGFVNCQLRYNNGTIIDYMSPTAVITSTTTKYICNIFFDTLAIRVGIGSISGNTITYLSTHTATYSDVGATRDIMLAAFTTNYLGKSAWLQDPYLNAQYHKISLIIPPSSSTYNTDTNLTTFTDMSTSNLITSTADGSLYTFDNSSNQITVTIRKNGGAPSVSTTALTIASNTYINTPGTSIYVENTSGTPIQYLLKNPTTSPVSTYSTILFRTTIIDTPKTITDLSGYVTSKTTATLSWTAANNSGSGSVITYSVFNGYTELTNTTIPAVSISGTTATLTNCVVGQTYNITVRTTVDNDTSYDSNTVSLMTGVPTTLPAGSVLWFDAADTSTITTSSGAITAWANKGSRTGQQFVTGTGGVLYGSATIAAKSVITNPTQKNLSLSSTGLGNEVTSIAVWQPTSLPGPGLQSTPFRAYADTGGAGISLINNGTAGSPVYQLLDGPANVVVKSRTVALSNLLNTVNIITSIVSATASNNGVTINGTVINLDISSSMSSGIAVGSASTYYTQGTGVYHDGAHNIAEIVEYTSALSASARQQAEGYLAWKWGQQGSLPASHPYRTAVILPSAPQNLAATMGANNANLTWTAPSFTGQGSIVNYTITAKQGGSTISTNTTTSTSFNVSGLTTLVSYTFEVVANNMYGSSSIVSVSDSTSTVPDAPKALSSVVNTTTGDISLNWTAPADNGATITSYRVYASGSLLSGVSIPAVAISGTSARITNATLGISYSFTVTAVNRNGESAQSSPLIVTPTRIPSTPNTPTAVAGNKLANLTWVAPSNGGSAITGYIISITKNGVSAGTTTAAALDTSKNIVDLSNGATYTFKIAATNSIGTSSYSVNSNPVIPDALPTGTVQINDLTTGSTYDVYSTLYTNASLLADEDRVGTLSYLWQIADTIGGTFTDISGAISATYSPIIADIGKFYRVLVSYTDGAGITYTGATAIVSAVAGPVRARRPYAPTGISAVAGSSSAIVTWTAPVNNGGAAITKYIVRHQQFTFLNTWSTSIFGIDASANATSLVYTSLTPGTLYRFVVNAVNSTGEGDWSAPTNEITPYTTASAPQNLVATPGSSQMRLTWSAPSSDGYSTITEYRISYSWPPSNSAIIDLSANGLTDLSYSITGLIPGTQYSFYVFAKNQADLGAMSNLATATPYTTPGVPQNVRTIVGLLQITLLWDPPASDGSSNIIAYRITVNGSSIIDLSANISSYTFTSLTLGSVYSYTVTAKNAAGYGSTSLVIREIAQYTPGPPRNVIATPGVSQNILSWSAPASDGANNIIGYRVTDNTGKNYDISAFPITPLSSNMMITDSKTTYEKSQEVYTSRWNTYIYGNESYVNGIYVAFTPNNPSGTYYYGIGIEANPALSTDSGTHTTDYYWYMDGSAGARAKHNNINLIPNITSNFRNLRYEIIYNGSTIRMLAGGVEYYRVNISSNQTFSFMAKMLVANASIKDLIVSSGPTVGLRSITITGLNPGLSYSYTILAKNAFGFGTPSASASAVPTG